MRPFLLSNYEFVNVALRFENVQIENVFQNKNNKTLSETLQHRRYKKFTSEVSRQYPNSLNDPLGKFLYGLKVNADDFYKNFLNKYGDGRFSIFSVAHADDRMKRGVYAFRVSDELKYIGRCKDSLKKRINQGYGKIHPKNCYLDGQATNCHLNGLITSAKRTVSLWLCELDSPSEIEIVERTLIRAHDPPWNIARS